MNTLVIGAAESPTLQLHDENCNIRGIDKIDSQFWVTLQPTIKLLKGLRPKVQSLTWQVFFHHRWPQREILYEAKHISGCKVADFNDFLKFDFKGMSESVPVGQVKRATYLTRRLLYDINNAFEVKAEIVQEGDGIFMQLRFLHLAKKSSFSWYYELLVSTEK